MLKISQIEALTHTVTLRLEGRVTGPWVAEARRACDQVLSAGQDLMLDLAEVEFLDANAVKLLTSLRARGVCFVACGPFIEAQLNAGVAAIQDTGSASG